VVKSQGFWVEKGDSGLGVLGICFPMLTEEA